MRVLQVKRYHSQIADKKYRDALEAWKERGYGYPVKEMTHFILDGEERKNGYVAYDHTSSYFFIHKEKAHQKLKENNCEQIRTRNVL